MNRAVTICLASILLFVVVCPVTPTPIAVIGGKSAQFVAPFVAIVVLVLGCALNATLAELIFQNEGKRPLVREKVLDLTCTLLC